MMGSPLETKVNLRTVKIPEFDTEDDAIAFADTLLIDYDTLLSEMERRGLVTVRYEPTDSEMEESGESGRDVRFIPPSRRMQLTEMEEYTEPVRELKYEKPIPGTSWKKFPSRGRTRSPDLVVGVSNRETGKVSKPLKVNVIRKSDKDQLDALEKQLEASRHLSVESDDTGSVSESVDEGKKKKENADKSTHRGFCFTDFELDKDFWEDFIAKNKVDYCIMAEEICSDTGRRHWQGFIYFTNKRTWNGTSNKLNPRHVEAMKKTPLAAVNYCKKGIQSHEEWSKLGCKGPNWGKELEIVYEYGKPPSGQGSREDLKALYDDIRSGVLSKELDIADKSPLTYMKYNKALMRVNELVQPQRWFKPEVIIFWGEGGKGKTYECYRMEKDVFKNGDDLSVVKATLCGDKNAPFVLEERVRGCTAIIFDDFNPDQVSPSYFLNVTDRYPFSINIKGTGTNFAARRIYFTSNVHPSRWWGGWTKQIYRRFTKIIEVHTDEDFDDILPKEYILDKTNPTAEPKLTEVALNMNLYTGAKKTVDIPKVTFHGNSQSTRNTWHSQPLPHEFTPEELASIEATERGLLNLD